MKKIYLLFLLLTSFLGAKAFDVTFSVDMNGTGLSNVSINGTFNNWCGYCAPMTDSNSDGIWEITLPLTAGTYEYKFTANSGGSWENLAPGSSCTVTNFGYTNRSLAVTANVTLPTVCWQSCVSCNQAPPSYPVTFQVDMTNVSGFTTPTVNGSFDGFCGNCHPLTDANADGVWETTLSLPAGTYEYKFAYDNWAGQENLIPGSSCTVTNFGYTNRAVTVSAATTIPTVCWASCVACAQVPPSYTVTFKVNMQEQTGFTTPEVNGTFNNWCGNCNPLTDANADGIWETTLTLSAGTYEYKFSADGWGSQENLTAGSSCTVTNNGYTNRALNLNANTTLDVVCWGSCVNCAPPTYPVTFKVDMANQTGFTTPEVNGTFNGWCGSCNPMTDANADGVWETTINLPAGSYEYKFSADGWGSQESLTAGSSCTVTNSGYTNRALTVGTVSQTLPVVCWGTCTACSAPTYNVTFKVDMTQTTGFTTPEVNGTFNGWCGSCTPMTDANADGVWEVTVALLPGSYEYKFSADGWGIQESLTAGTSCTVTNFGYTNRALTVGTAAQVLGTVCWNSCSACVIATPGCTNAAAANYNAAATIDNGSCLYATQFNVDMNCAGTAFTNVYVTGPWCGWCGAAAYNILTDSNSDGIYTVTVNLAAGNVEYKYMVDDWASQENLVDDMLNGGSCAPVTDYANYANRQSPTGQVKNDVYGRCSACPILGCMNATACNYNSAANQDNGTCTFATTWYLDADADGYYVSSTSSCTSPGAGYTGTAGISGDCNDNNSSVRPGVTESCVTAFDDNCNGQINEGCAIIAGDNPSNATSVATSIWPNCSASNGTLVGAGASASAQTICLTGEDKWHQFVATSEGVSIVVSSTSADILIELQTAAGVLVAQENAIDGLGGETLNHYGLIAGQVYRVGVRNYNSALGTGTYTICVKMLKRGGCDYGPGPYSLCQYFKATWAGATGSSYTFTFTGVSGPASGNVYTRTQTSDICVLSTVLPTLPYGSTYSVLITNTYSINNGAGVAETISVPGLAPCSMSTAAQPVTALRTSDRCAAGPRFRGAIVASLPWVCGATNWRWEFTELDAQSQPVGLPISVNRGAASNYINLGSVLQLQYGKTYSVRTAPILPYTGTDYVYGPAFDMCIIGTSGMIADDSQDAAQGSTKEASQNVAQGLELSVYPNPTNGNNIQLMLSGMNTELAQVRILDAMGKQIWSNNFNTLELSNTSIELEQGLADGMYFLQIVSGEETISQRFLVRK